MKTVLEEIAKVLFDMATCIPEKGPNIKNGDPLFPTNLLDPLGILLCDFKVTVEKPRRVSRREVRIPLVDLWSDLENHLSADTITDPREFDEEARQVQS